MREALQPAVTEINTQPDYFAEGFLTDDDGPWRMVVNVREGATYEASRCHIQALLPPDSPVVFRPVKYSQNELLRISEQIPTLVPVGGAVHAWGPDNVNIRVNVYVHANAAEIERVLRGRFGDAVAVVLEPEPQPI